MKIVVCVRQGLDGELSPFDASAYEAALRVSGAEVILLSMGPASAKDFLLRLTRLGARRAILLSDSAFAGADTLATAYTLSLAIKRLSPDLIFTGRQTLVGDTAQTGPMLSVFADTSLITGVMELSSIQSTVVAKTREEGELEAKIPALLTFERIHALRMPSIFAKLGEVEIWTATDIGADVQRCGLAGSPTRVKRTFENASGKRKCTFISPTELDGVIATALVKKATRVEVKAENDEKIDGVWSVGTAPLSYANSVCDSTRVVDEVDEKTLIKMIKEEKPTAVIFGSDAASKRLSARVSAALGLGLCADCTELSVEEDELVMIRPALSGSIIAKIISKTSPKMATVRTTKASNDIVVAVGYGAAASLELVRRFADAHGAELSATRKVVDNDLMPYSAQVGLTGKTVSPPVYITFGVSGAVHHIVGMQSAGVVIAVNEDKNAPIFDYADYGIVAKIEDVLK